MRFSTWAGAMGLCLVPLSLGFASVPPTSSKASVPEPPTQPAKPSGPDLGPTDAAKHAKRTACLKEAKARRLVGAGRNAYVKECVAAP